MGTQQYGSNKTTVKNSGFEASFTDLTQFQSGVNGSFAGKDDPFQIGESNVQEASAANDPLSFKNFYLGSDLCNDSGFGDLIPSKIACSGGNLESLDSIEDNITGEPQIRTLKNSSYISTHSLDASFNSGKTLNNMTESHCNCSSSRNSDFDFESFGVGSPLWKNSCNGIDKHDRTRALSRYNLEPKIADGILADLDAVYAEREQDQKHQRRLKSIMDRNDYKGGEGRNQKRKKNGVIKGLFRKQD